LEVYKSDKMVKHLLFLFSKEQYRILIDQEKKAILWPKSTLGIPPVSALPTETEAVMETKDICCLEKWSISARLPAA
jgi:hypothetical protein